MSSQPLIETAAKAQKILKSLGVESVIIGALAPFLLATDMSELSSAYGELTTRDVDTLLAIDSWPAYNELLRELQKNGFVKLPGDPEHRLSFKGIEIDLLPVGKILKQGMLNWPISRSLMNMQGAEEALAKGQQIDVGDNQSVRVVPLWSFVVLKLFAYDDRGAKKDAEAIVSALVSYGETDDRRFSVPDGLTYETSGAFLCGQDVKDKALPETSVALKRLLTKLLEMNEYSRIINDIVGPQADNDEREFILSLFQAFLKGLE